MDCHEGERGMPRYISMKQVLSYLEAAYKVKRKMVPVASEMCTGWLPVACKLQELNQGKRQLPKP